MTKFVYKNRSSLLRTTAAAALVLGAMASSHAQALKTAKLVTQRAVCILPVPDGGGIDPTRANVYGNIERVDLPLVTIKDGKSGLLEQVSVAKITEIYSV